MGQQSEDAARKDAQIMSSIEECALDMVQRGQRSNAALRDAQAKPSEEVCA